MLRQRAQCCARGVCREVTRLLARLLVLVLDLSIVRGSLDGGWRTIGLPAAIASWRAARAPRWRSFWDALMLTQVERRLGRHGADDEHEDVSGDE